MKAVKKKSERNPYVNKLTLRQVANAEENFYYLQVGEEIAEYGGKFTFTKDRVEWLFQELMDSMLVMIKEGNSEDRSIARAGLMNFHIRPLRIH